MFEAEHFFQTKRHKRQRLKSHKTISFWHRWWTFYWFQSKWIQYNLIVLRYNDFLGIVHIFMARSAITQCTIARAACTWGVLCEIRFCIILSVCSRFIRTPFTISVLHYFFFNIRSCGKWHFWDTWNVK